MPQWVAREYLARRGHATFSSDQIAPARCPLLGYALKALMIEGQTIGNWFLRVDRQPEVGPEAYDKGAAMLHAFFLQQLAKFDVPELDPLGRRIIEAARRGASLEEYVQLLPGDPILSYES